MKTFLSTALLATSLLAFAPLAAQSLLASAEYSAFTPSALAQGTYCFVVTDAFAANSGLVAETAPEPTTEQVLTALVQQVIATTQQQDSTTLARFLAPEYRHYTPDNQVATRKAELNYIGSASNPFASAKVVGPITVSTYGTTGVTVSKILFGAKNSTGNPTPQFIQMMMVWVQRGGHWQIVTIDSKMLPAPKMAKG
jgi:hypothetical protein